MTRLTRISAAAIVGVLSACSLTLLVAARVSAQTSLDGRYQVTEEDNTAGNGDVSNFCPTPWTLEPSKTSNRDDGTVKVTTEGDTVTFARDDGTVLLTATLSTQDVSFTGTSGTSGQSGSMSVGDSLFGPAKFDLEASPATFSIPEPHVNVGTQNECWQVQINGRRIEGGDVATGPSSALPAPTKQGKSGNPGILILIGGAVVTVTIGGITVSRRRRRRTPRRVPAPCQPALEELDEALNVVATLKTMETTLRTSLEAGIRNQQVNLIKATLVAGVKTVEIVSNAATAVRSARAANLGEQGLGVMENAPAPGMLSGRAKAALDAAEAAWEAAKGQVADLRAALQGIEEAAKARMAPVVEAAERDLAIDTARVANLESRLPNATSIREALVDVEQELDQKTIAWNEAKKGLDQATTALEDAQGKLAAAADQGKVQVDAAQAAWQTADDELYKARMELNKAQDLGRHPGTISELKQNVERLDTAAKQRLSAFKQAQQTLGDGIAHQGEKVRDLEQKVAEAVADKNVNKLGDDVFRLQSQRDLLTQRARAVDGVTEQSIAEAKQQVTAAQQALADSRNSVDPLDAARIADAKAKLAAAEQQARDTETALQMNRRGAGAVSESGVIAPPGTDPGLIRTGLRAGGELIQTMLIGGAATYGQSNEEIDTILRNGQEWIKVMKTRVNAIEREIDSQVQNTVMLRHALQLCLDGQKAEQAAAAPMPAGVS